MEIEKNDSNNNNFYLNKSVDFGKLITIPDINNSCFF